MKIRLCFTFFLMCGLWQGSQCVNIKRVEDEDIKKDVRVEKRTRNIRGDLNKIIGSFPINNVGGIPIKNVFVENGNKIGNGVTNIDNGDIVIFDRNGYAYEYDAGNPDIHGEILRPCQAYDSFCIRKFFARHSLCKISGRALPDLLYRAQSTVNFASANISEMQINSYYGGLNNARVTEFYINKVTDNLVIAFTFDSVIKYSNNTYYRFHLRNREPVVTRDFGRTQFGVLTITVIIPQLHDLRLEKAEIFTYGDSNIYSFALGPGVAPTTDPEAAAMYARFYTNVPTEYQEEISDQGYFIVGNYIQYNICDFGLKTL